MPELKLVVRSILVVLATALLAGSVDFARAAQPPAGGATFVGQIGSLDVVACLGAGTAEDRYYYLKRGKTLYLTPHAVAEDTWVEREPSEFPGPEDDDAAQWRLREEEESKLTGTWRPNAEARRKGRAALPVRLRRVAAGCEEFERRRLQVPERAVGSGEGSSPFVTFRRHGLAEVVHLRVIGGAPPAVLEKIGRRLDAQFDTAVAESFDCREYSLGGRVELFGDLLVADLESAYYCGGPHPGESYTLLAFDLRTGELVSHERQDEAWFPELSSDLTQPGEGLPGLLAAEVDPEDCREYLSPGTIWPDPFGVSFRLWTDARSGAGCRQDILLSYAQVIPFANPGAEAELESWRRRLEGQHPVVVSAQP